MKLKPIYIYKCPSCANFVKKNYIMEDYKHGMKFYTDFSINISKYHISPQLAKCRNCNTIYWLRKENKREQNNYWDENKEQIITSVRFLDLDDYFITLSNGLVTNQLDEQYVRRQIWCLYNDRVKQGKALYNDTNDLVRWSINLERLLTLFDPSEIYSKVMIAEINRNLGAFDNCISILKSIVSNKLVGIREQLIDECKRNNKWVVEICLVLK